MRNCSKIDSFEVHDQLQENKNIYNSSKFEYEEQQVRQAATARSTSHSRTFQKSLHQNQRLTKGQTFSNESEICKYQQNNFLAAAKCATNKSEFDNINKIDYKQQQNRRYAENLWSSQRIGHWENEGVGVNRYAAGGGGGVRVRGGEQHSCERMPARSPRVNQQLSVDPQPNPVIPIGSRGSLESIHLCCS
jgi:hypothetical protein